MANKMDDYDYWYKPCEKCGYDTAKTTSKFNCRCWQCGNFVVRDFSERALKKGVAFVPPVLKQAETAPIVGMGLPAAGPSLKAIQEAILLTMRDLCENAQDTVWLTESETVFERLAEIHGIAGGGNERLAALWPEYFKNDDGVQND